MTSYFESATRSDLVYISTGENSVCILATPNAGEI